MPLDFGEEPVREAQPQLEALSVEAFPGARSYEGALAGLWLYFGFEAEAHEIAQELPTPEGNFWHAIIHRREPDAWNANYWFQRVGRHAVFEPLADQAAALAQQHPAAGYVPGKRWDPSAFVDFCETARRQPGSEAEALAREVQLAEWQLLFEYCARKTQ
jgi:hypothetical protein